MGSTSSKTFGKKEVKQIDFSHLIREVADSFLSKVKVVDSVPEGVIKINEGVIKIKEGVKVGIVRRKRLNHKVLRCVTLSNN